MIIKILVTKNFDKWARGQKLTDSEIVVATQEMKSGLVEASLGAMFIKNA